MGLRFLASVTLAAGISACSSHAHSAPDAGASTTRGPTEGSARSALTNGPYWMLSGVALQMLQPDPSASRLADSPRTFLISGNKLNLVPAGSAAVPVESFTSFPALDFAVTHDRLSPRIRAVIYDDENWSLTPRDEQLDPASYEERAAAVAHSHGLLFIAAPAVDLTTELEPGAGKTFAKYLTLGLAASAARYADVIDIQAQGSELDPTAYEQFVTASATQARQANPKVIVLAGLSTNPHGPAIPLANLVEIVHATEGSVDGYWINIPVPGPSCPGCDPPQPALALQMLHALGD